VNQNIVWAQKWGYIAYSMQNIMIFEELNAEKTQQIKEEFSDPISGIRYSKDEGFIMAFTRVGTINGYPSVIVWNTKTKRKESVFAVEDTEIINAEFSKNSNMILVASWNGDSKNPLSTVSVWDFMNGRKEVFCKSVIPWKINEICWNGYETADSSEFCTLSDQVYHYWQIRDYDLALKYMQGRMPKDYFVGENANAKLTSLCYVEPYEEQNSVYALMGLDNGHVWVVDTRGNYFLYHAKVLDGPINKITSSLDRIVIEGKDDSHVHSWELRKTIADYKYDASDPNYFFAGEEKSV